MTSAATGGMYIAGGAVFGDGGDFRAVDPASGTTSVGTRAMERFLRPVAYQDVPDALLPAAVREASPDGLLRLTDGAYRRD